MIGEGIEGVLPDTKKTTPWGLNVNSQGETRGHVCDGRLQPLRG